MSLTITRNNSFKFETNQPIGFRVTVSSSVSKNVHIITPELWNGEENNVNHPMPTICLDTDYQDGIGIKAETIHSDHPAHNETLHYQNNPRVKHQHILYKNKADMLMAFEKDFPEQSKMMHNMFANKQHDSAESSNLTKRFKKLFGNR